ncbi:hypothetical protein CC80DRAFT_442254 [Byssothecium circinans]|uniref:Uncharacterized protein n=1 Tax=Byssothecium circinans TaxID=147558 RepID=A0A6A5U144_9PLEO|nr:hypothetical protein CC80DRAFT_442254 [Byssothecium circinans]
MLAPRASSAFVCIRCELHLTRPLPLLTRRAAFSTSARRRNENETLQPEPALEHEGDRFRIHRPQLSEHPLGRTRKRKGKGRLRETTASLGGVKTLGDDAEILVLKEVGDDGPAEESVTPEVVLPSDPLNPINIMGSLQEERKPITSEEIVQQLNSLRPKTYAAANEPQYINQSTFIRLSQKLIQSFTRQQLSHYYSVTKGVERKNVEMQVLSSLKESLKKTTRPAERSDWHPGTTQIDRRLPGLDVHRTKSKRPIGKHLIVDQILRDVWNLVLLEEIESPGEIELSLKPWQLSLLTSGSSPTPLDRIGQDRKAKVEIFGANNVVRITADKNTAEYAADDIEQLIQNVETKSLDLEAWAPYLAENTSVEGVKRLFSEKDLRAVSTMTEASIFVTSERSVVIRALNTNSIAEAERCLIKMLPLKEDVEHTIDTTRRDATKDQSYLSTVHFDPTAVDWKLRNQHFGRWMLPVTRSPEPATAIGGEPSDELLDNTKQGILKMVDRATDLPEDLMQKITGDWSSRPEVSVVTEFGSVMYSMGSSQDDVHAETALPPFLPSTPGLVRLLKDQEFSLTQKYGSPPSLHYSFIAAPEQRLFDRGQQFPRLSILFRPNPQTGKHSVRKIYLSLNESVHDVLLPDKAVDLRFVSNAQLQMHPSSGEKSIRGFIHAVLENLQSGGKLTAPNINLDIPTWTIPGQPSDAKGTSTVRYLFTGVRFRQSVAGSLFGGSVSLGTVQSGKLGRKGAALTAYFNSDPKMPGYSDLKDDTRLGEFVKKSFAIADKVTETARHVQSPVIHDKKERKATVGDTDGAGKARQVVANSAAEGDTTRMGTQEKTGGVEKGTEQSASGETVLRKNPNKTEKNPNSARALRRQAIQATFAAEAAEAGESAEIAETSVQNDAKEVEQSDSTAAGDIARPVDQQDNKAKDTLEEQSPATQQLEDGYMDDPYLANILSDKTSKTNEDSSPFTPPQEESNEAVEREDDGPMKSVA